MKRYISLVCVALIVVMCMASPVSAFSFESVSYIDLLSLGYFYNNDSIISNSMFRVSSGGNGRVSFPVVSDVVPGKFEFFVYTNMSDIILTSDTGVSLLLNESTLGSRYYIVSGDFGGAAPHFNYSSSTGGYFYILDAKMLPYNYTVSEITYDFQVFDASNGSILTSLTGQTRTEFQDEFYYDSIDSPFVRQIRIYPNKDQLAGMDYFDLDIYLQDLEVGSISASFGGNVLDVQYTTSFIGDGIFNNGVDFGEIDQDKSYGCYKVDLRVDVSGINLLDGAPTVFITYTANNYGSRSPYIFVYGINSGILWKEKDPYILTLQNLFSSLHDWFASHTSSMQLQFSLLDFSLDEYFSNLNSRILSFVTSMQIEFSQLKNALISHFVNLHDWIDSQTARLEAAIRGDTAPGDSFQDEVDEKDQQLNDMAAVMDSVDQPDLNSVNVSADTYVDSIVLAASMSGITSVFSQGLYLNLIVMSIMMATAGYVLFGKR